MPAGFKTCGLQEKAMLVERYRILSPILALVPKDGSTVAHLVPEGAIVSVDRVDTERLVNVEWDGTKAMMYAQDLSSRGKKIDGAHLVHF